MTTNTDLKNSLTYSLRNLFKAGITEDSKNTSSISEKDPNSVLYKIKEDKDLDKNDSFIVLTNISEQTLVIPKDYSLRVYWNDIVSNQELEGKIGITYVPRTGETSDLWTIGFLTQKPPTRYWQLQSTKEIRLQPKSELKFKASNIRPRPDVKDVEKLKFESNSTNVFTSVSFFDLEGNPVDSPAIPINRNFSKPLDNSWNVAQNKLQLLHPAKGINEVFSNTLKGATIESRLAFAIENPSTTKNLEAKSANADPRFVISISYGDGVRALSRMEGYQPPFTEALQLNGDNDYLWVENEFPSTRHNGLTVSIWAKSDTPSWNGSAFLVSLRDCFILHPMAGSKEVRFYIWLDEQNDWISISCNPAIDITEWHQYMGIYDYSKQTISLYIDGDKVSETGFSGTIKRLSGSLYLGWDTAHKTSFRGQLAHACIWNKPCNQQEIQAMMAGSLTGQEERLFIYYRLDSIVNQGGTPQVLNPIEDWAHYKAKVNGNPTIVESSPKMPVQRSTSQGVDLKFDGIVGGTNQNITFVKSDSGISGIRSWTFKPLNKNLILEPLQKLCLVFKGICPDDTLGEAYITIGYYDIKGYKDGLAILSVSKVEPRPYLIEPKEPLNIDVKNPTKAINLSWKVFGADSVTLTSKDSKGQLTNLATNLPLVAENYNLNFPDYSLWQDLDLYLMPQSLELLGYKIATTTYKGALGVKWRQSVHHSDWIKSRGHAQHMALSIADTLGTDPDEIPPEGLREVAGSRYLSVDYDTFNRLSLKYEGEGNDGKGKWNLILEIINFAWPTPKIDWESAAPSRLDGGGYFPLEDITFLEDGSIRFTVKEMETLTFIKEGQLAERYGVGQTFAHKFETSKRNISGIIKNVNGEPVVSDDFVGGITTDPSNAYNLSLGHCHTYGSGCLDGRVRPPLFRSSWYLEEEDQTAIGKQLLEVSKRLYAVSDWNSQKGSKLQFLKANNNKPPQRDLQTRSLETQDFHGQSLQEQDFSETNLDQANFDGADLQSANFEGNSLVQASFEGGNLVLVNCSYTNLRGANLMDAQLNYGKFLGANFDGANLTRASLIGANLSFTNFVGANLTHTNFDTAIVEGTRFSTDSGLSDEQVQDLQQRGAIFVERRGSFTVGC